MSQPPDGPVRVLRLIARLNVGGPAIQAISLTSLLEPLGYSTILLRGEEGPREGSMDYLADELGVSPVKVAGLTRKLGPHDLRALVEIMRWLRRARPHVLHTHTAKAGTLGRLAVLLSPRHRPPVVVHTFHGHVFQGEFSPRATAVFARIERLLAPLTTRLIAVSDEVRQDLIDLEIAPPERIETVRLGFDLRPFAEPEGDRREIRRQVRERLGIPADAKVVSVVARVVKIKRIDRFLAMAQRLGDLPDVRFVVVGDGDLRPELEHSAAARELGDRLVWAGFWQDIPPICFASDVVALTSDNEGTPVCLIEAQAAGLPVVSTRVGGVATVIQDGESGHIVDQDPDELAAAVRGLLADPDRATRFGERGREHALAGFSIERLVGDIDGLYRRLLPESSAVAPRLRPSEG